MSSKRQMKNPPFDGGAFRKFSDNQIKKSPKRLNRKPANAQRQGFKPNDRTYVQRLLSSIKRRTLFSPSARKSTNMHMKRKLDFRIAELRRGDVAGRNNSPKPTFYNQMSPQSSTSAIRNYSELNDECEIIDIATYVVSSSSDEEDCVILEPSNSILDDDQRNSSESLKLRQNAIYEDSSRSVSLLYTPQSSNGLMYNALAECDMSQPVNKSNLSDVTKEGENASAENEIISLLDDTEDFIRLPDDEPSSPVECKREGRCDTSQKPSGSDRNSLFTSTEKRQLSAYNSNTYNPTAGTEKPAKKGNKRTVLIDASNVAFGHACSNGFSAEGVKICIDYFTKMGHDVKAVMPMFRKNRDKSSNPELIDQLHKEGKVVFTPCKNLPGQFTSSYDDRFILQLASECDAAIISNDNYRDLMSETPAFKKIIENRVIGYTWCNDIFLLPKDPYGRRGPTLDEILHK